LRQALHALLGTAGDTAEITLIDSNREAKVSIGAALRSSVRCAALLCLRVSLPLLAQDILAMETLSNWSAYYSDRFKVRQPILHLRLRTTFETQHTRACGEIPDPLCCVVPTTCCFLYKICMRWRCMDQVVHTLTREREGSEWAGLRGRMHRGLIEEHVPPPSEDGT
jgi:hypothetical protein